MLASESGERFVRSLNDTLRANVDPASGRHLSVHRELKRFETIEFVASRPFGNEVRIGDQHSWGVVECFEDPNRFSGLNEKRFVVFEILQRSNDRVKGFPTSR